MDTPTAKKHSTAFSVRSWGIRNHFQALVAILIAALVLATIYLPGKNNEQSTNNLATHKNSSSSTSSESLEAHQNSSSSNNVQSSANSSGSNNVQAPESLAPAQENSSGSPSECDLFSGKWVFDPSSYPLYVGRECNYMNEQVACDKSGRPDSKYQHWRWQPHQCDLPRFNATAMLEMLRGKRLVYVGDSLNRGQWYSMICLVQSSIPPSQKTLERNGQDGNLFMFKALEYNASIEFYWSPFLLESNSDHPITHRMINRIVRVNSIEKHARHWTDADILVFNTYLWWRRPSMTMKLLWGSFDNPEGIYKEVELLRSYEMALKTWSDWLELQVNRNKTKMFFASMSPTHVSSYEWGSGNWGGNCYNETEPITKEGHWGVGSDGRMMRLVEAAINELGKRGVSVRMLNITQMSEYRKDGHTSIYWKGWEPFTPEQLANPPSYADCGHWCLPGVPDAWNEILYALLLNPSPSPSPSLPPLSSSSSPSTSS